MLVEAALAWARLAGATRTELGVYDFNEGARAFWASLGFQVLSYRMVRHSAPTRADANSALQKSDVVDPEVEGRLLGRDRKLE